MKNGLLYLNIVLLLAVAVLFYLQFSKPKAAVVAKTATNTTKGAAVQAGGNGAIAYFEMDSLEAAFAMVKDVKSELSKREEAVNGELRRMEQNYKAKAQQYQNQAATMSQTQSEMATRDMMQLQQSMQSRKQTLDNEFQDYYMRRMKEVKTKIEDYLRQYNQSKGYSYIFAYDPGLFYYKDSVHNITADLIKGLNAGYTTTAKKK